MKDHILKGYAKDTELEDTTGLGPLASPNTYQMAASIEEDTYA